MGAIVDEFTSELADVDVDQKSNEYGAVMKAIENN